MTYLNQQALLFKDPDDLEIILANNNHNLPKSWRKNPYSNIPTEHQILGMGPVEYDYATLKKPLIFTT